MCLLPSPAQRPTVAPAEPGADKARARTERLSQVYGGDRPLDGAPRAPRTRRLPRASLKFVISHHVPFTIDEDKAVAYIVDTRLAVGRRPVPSSGRSRGWQQSSWVRPIASMTRTDHPVARY